VGTSNADLVDQTRTGPLRWNRYLVSSTKGVTEVAGGGGR
jgi:hypothetical protein